MTHMFLHVRDLREKNLVYTSDHVEPSPDIPSLVALTGVCHVLRTMALSFPRLWTIVPASLPSRLTSAFLERSAGLPLRVHVSVTDRYWWSPPPIFDQPYRSRIRELCIVKAPHDASNYAKILSILAPHLTYLNMSLDKNFGQAHMVSPSDIFSGTTPTALTAFSHSLKSAIFPVGSFPSLIHLRISAEDRRFDVYDLLNLLEDAPMLETLYILHGEGVYTRHPERESLRTIRLPRLRALCLDKVEADQAFFILARLDPPPDVMVQVHRTKIRDLKALNLFDIPPIGELTTLEVAREGLSFHIRVRGTRGGFWLDTYREHAAIDLRDLTAALFARIEPRLATVHTLRLAALPFESHARPTLLEILVAEAALMPKVSTLVVAHRNDIDRDRLAPALERILSPVEPSGAVPLPALRTLGVQTYRAIPNYEPIVRLLAARGRAGYPVRDVSLSIGCEDEPEFVCVCCSGVADEVEMAESKGEMLWDIENDPYWSVETPYWPLYPDEEYRRWMWNLPNVGW